MLVKAAIAIFFIFTSEVTGTIGTNDTIAGSIQLILLVHPHNKLELLPFVLGGIESQLYPKDRINIYIRTEKLNGRDETFAELNSRTIESLKIWRRENRDDYHQIELDIDDEEFVNDQQYQSEARIRNI